MSTGEVILAGVLAATDADNSRARVEALVREHSRTVFRVAFSVLRNHTDAEDATQETFLRVWRHSAKPSAVEDARLWLIRIAWRVAVDKTKQRPAQPSHAVEDVVEELRSTEPGADHVIDSRRRVAMLEQLIPTLPMDLRQVLILSTVEEMSHAEIAAVLEIPNASVRTRLMRARQMLREKLERALKEHKRG